LQQSLAEGGLRKNSTIAVATVVSNIDNNETLIAVNHGQQHDRECALVVIVQTAGVCRTFNDDVFAVYGAAAMRHLPCCFECLSRTFPCVRRRVRQILWLKGIPQCFANSRNNAMNCCHPDSIADSNLKVQVSRTQIPAANITTRFCNNAKKL